MSDDRIEQLRTALKFDAIDTAERLTGQSSHSDEATVGLGLALHVRASARRQRLLENTGDTTFSNTVDRYVRVIKSLGFEQVLDFPFVGRSWGDESPPSEHLYVFFDRKRGILLKFDTHGSERVNGGKFYYNWRPRNGTTSGVISSGHFSHEDNAVWVGDHDCREGVKFHIQELERHGDFVTPWVDGSWLSWLSIYTDERDDFKTTAPERLNLLPVWVLEAINKRGNR